MATNVMNCDSSSLTLGVCGASGALVARTLIAQFLEYSSWHLELIFTETAEQVWHYELDEPLPQNGARITLHSVSQLTDALASGSTPSRGMIIAPCSLATLAKIAHGMADNLLTRAADVTIKERRSLILVPRESPLSAIHLRNMLSLAELGVCIAPPMLTMYTRPQDMQQMVAEFTAHILSLVGIDVPRTQWGVQ